MVEHPILFSTEMIKAILENRKTQTRRIIQPQPKSKLIDGTFTSYPAIFKNDKKASLISPYGSTGDQLWVRETWHKNDPIPSGPSGSGDYIYKADECEGCQPNTGKWKPSIFMPRKASRIQLEIIDLKIERLQDITEEDAFAEGIQIEAIQKEGMVHPLVRLTGKYLPMSYGNPTKAKSYYAALWDSLNEKRGYNWEKNPFVWKIEFGRIK